MDLTPLDRHERIVLQFSGGKDSIACLLLLRPYLDRIAVLWLNTGDPLPEHAAQMERVRALVPHFIEINTDVQANFDDVGWPTDVLPIRNDRQVQFLAQQQRLPLQSFMACCYNNLMQPMHDATLRLGATLIIRGQKRADSHKSPLHSGMVMAGVEYWFPVEDWTDAQVLDYIGDTDLLPAHFEPHHTSLDCWSCTAYLAEHEWKQPYLEQHHPEKGAEVRRRLVLIRNEIMRDMKHMGVSNG
jgi:3''-phosphoadenosine 5''-phosphosulfate sulfotransferase (PAPS reductase)/FAD synthetase and related enzymes